MPHHVIAEHLRRIARHLEETPAEERQRIERLAQRFEEFVDDGTAPDERAAAKEQLLVEAESIARAFQRRSGKTFREMTIAMHEFREAVQRLHSR
jgi:transcription elongation GreA/GreB family factor